MSEQRIFVDLDGVLADWTGAACRALGRHPNDPDWSKGSSLADALGVSMNEMWRAVDAAGEDFWANLEPYPWAGELWYRACATGPSIVLTSPSYHPSSLAGKLRWMNRHLADGGNFRDYLIGPCKTMCASYEPGSLLIDDRASSCKAFREAGGDAVLFPRPWNGAEPHGDPMAAMSGYLVPLRGQP